MDLSIQQRKSWRVTHTPNHVLSFPHIKIACSQPSQEIVVILTSHIWNVPHCCSQLRREREKERAETNTRWAIYRSIGPSLPTITITDLTTATLTFATSGASPFPEPLLDRDLNHPRSHSCPCLSCVPLRKTYLRSTGRQWLYSECHWILICNVILWLTRLRSRTRMHASKAGKLLDVS